MKHLNKIVLGHYIDAVWIGQNLTSAFHCCIFSSFFSFLVSCSRGQRLLFMNSSRTFPIFRHFISPVDPVHCSRAHKFHFSATFSLKMGLTALFTHLKIILLQCFQFQFLVSAKISSIQTDLLYCFYILKICVSTLVLLRLWQTYQKSIQKMWKLLLVELMT